MSMVAKLDRKRSPPPVGGVSTSGRVEFLTDVSISGVMIFERVFVHFFQEVEDCIEIVTDKLRDSAQLLLHFSIQRSPRLTQAFADRAPASVVSIERVLQVRYELTIAL